MQPRKTLLTTFLYLLTQAFDTKSGLCYTNHTNHTYD